MPKGFRGKEALARGGRRYQRGHGPPWERWPTSPWPIPTNSGAQRGPATAPAGHRHHRHPPGQVRLLRWQGAGWGGAGGTRGPRGGWVGPVHPESDPSGTPGGVCLWWTQTPGSNRGCSAPPASPSPTHPKEHPWVLIPSNISTPKPTPAAPRRAPTVLGAGGRRTPLSSAMAPRGSLLLLALLLLASAVPRCPGQHWSHGWYPGGKRDLAPPRALQVRALCPPQGDDSPPPRAMPTHVVSPCPGVTILPQGLSPPG